MNPLSPCRRLLLCVMVFLIFLANGCKERQRIPDSKAFATLSDFTLAGSGPSEYPRDKTVPDHGLDAISVSGPLKLHTQYIFHHRSPMNTEKLALSDLPAKMRNGGLQILNAPQSSRDMLYSYVGGPVFTIKFQEGNHIGFIFSGLCPSFGKQADNGWAGNDYVLVYTQ